MIKRGSMLTSALLAVLLLVWLVPAAPAEDLGKMRVQLMDGSWLTGQVEQRDDGSYLIAVRKGITLPLKASEVKAILPLEEESDSAAGTAPSGLPEKESFRREISDSEIEKLLTDINVEALDVGTDTDVPALPVDKESVAEMVFLAGADPEENVLETDHFVLVFTGEKADAKRLMRRFEAVWRWNVKFFRIIGVPVDVPEHKLEVYLFGTFEEYQTHRVNTGSGRAEGALGYFSPMTNRSHFYNMTTFPPAAQRLRQAEDPRVPPKARRRHENVVKRWAEFETMGTTQHEVGHHIHFNLGLYPMDVFLDEDAPDQFPRWLVEGTTMMFEVPPTSAGASLGVINHSRLDEFRQRSRQSRFTPDSLKRFVVNNGVWHSGYYYPEGWSLVYYLRKNHPDGFAKYQKIMSARVPGEIVDADELEKEFEECFGKIDEDWVKKWYEYMDDLPLRRSLLPVDLRAP